jgi:hypothetical protein
MSISEFRHLMQSRHNCILWRLAEHDDLRASFLSDYFPILEYEFFIALRRFIVEHRYYFTGNSWSEVIHYMITLKVDVNTFRIVNENFFSVIDFYGDVLMNRSIPFLGIDSIIFSTDPLAVIIHFYDNVLTTTPLLSIIFLCNIFYILKLGQPILVDMLKVQLYLNLYVQTFFLKQVLYSNYLFLKKVYKKFCLWKSNRLKSCYF